MLGTQVRNIPNFMRFQEAQKLFVDFPVVILCHFGVFFILAMACVPLQYVLEFIALQEFFLFVVPPQNAAMLLEVAKHSDNSKHIDDRLC